MALTRRDKARRTAVAVLVVACVAGLAVAVASTPEVDDRGEEVRQSGEPGAVTLSGDAEALGTVPAPPQAGGGARTGDIVERVFPPRDSEQLRRVQAGIDLVSPYTATLVVNGVEVPDSQLVRRPETNQVFFTPGEGLVVEQWQPGRNCVRAVIWNAARDRAAEERSLEWCFQVT